LREGSVRGEKTPRLSDEKTAWAKFLVPPERAYD